MALSKREATQNQKRILKAHQTAQPRPKATLKDVTASIENSTNESSAFSENLQNTIGPQLSQEDLALLLESQGIDLSQVPPEMQEMVLSQLQSQYQSQSQNQSTGTSNATSPEAEAELTGKYKKLKEEMQASIGGTFFPLYSMAKAANPQSVFAADCKVLLQHGPALSDRLARLSKAYPKVYEILNRTSKVMPILAVAGELYAIGAAIAANHGINVPGFPA